MALARSAGTTTAHNHAATDLTSGTVAAARLGSGVASSTTFLRGDNTWATPPSVGSTGTSGVVFVNALGGLGDDSTNETTTLQNIINSNVGKVITFDPQGIYRVQQLLLPSNTHLNLNGATIRRFNNTAGSTNGTLRNSDFTNGNTNITVRDGTIDYASGTSGRAWVMDKVTNVRVQNLTLSKGAGTFTDFIFFWARCQYVRVDNIRITGGTAVGEDGFHVKSCSELVATNCIIDSGDDAIVLVHETNEPSSPIRNIAISNCVISSNNANAIRLSVYPTETQPIEDVTFDNIVIRTPPSGSAGGNIMTIGDDSNTGLLRRVNMSNIVINASVYTNNVVLTNMWDSQFSNWRLYNVPNRAMLITNLNRSVFSNVVADTNRSNNPLFELVSCTNVKWIGCEARRATFYGWTVTGTGSRDIEFVGCKVQGAAQFGWRLFYAARVMLVGCTYDNANISTGTAQAGAPVTLDTTNPPSDVRIVGCNFTGYTGGSAVTNPASGLSEYIGNTDLQNRGNQLSNTKLGFFGTTPVAKPAVSGSRAGNAALASLITQLASLGLITDSTS